MRVLLRPVLVPELGLVVLKPGRESIQIFHNPRVLVEPEPKSMRNLPSGVVPAVRQPLAEDKTLLPFFSNERVIRAAGGVGALSDWLLRHVTSCQWPNGDYHHTETVIHRYGTGAMVLCWHCDNQLRDQTSESLELLAQQNLTAWVIDVIRHAISGTQERELSLAELSWLNRPGFPGECFICELRLPDHRFRWKHNKLFLLLPVVKTIDALSHRVVIRVACTPC